jgi:hypothetical protein
MAAHNQKTTVSTPHTLGNAAVNGLIVGLVAGIVMAVYLVLAGLTLGNSPIETLSQFARSNESPLVGLITHLAVASVYGILFALISFGWHRVGGRLPMAVWMAGTLYGFGLWFLASNLFIASAMPQLLAIPPLHFCLAHLIYGLSLGIGLKRYGL